MITALGVDHVTYQVDPRSLQPGMHIEHFMAMLGLEEVPVREDVPDGWKVRWWEAPGGLCIHCAAIPGRTRPDFIDYGHFCLVVPEQQFARIRDSGRFIERDSGSGRVWLACSGVRVELRSTHRDIAPGGSPGDPENPSEVTREVDGSAWPESDSPQPPLGVPVEGVMASGRGAAQLEVFKRALDVFEEREEKYKEHWKRYGWRGALAELRKAAERAWHLLWNKEPAPFGENQGDYTDDLLDVINYAAFAVRAVEEGNRDGEGGWW